MHHALGTDHTARARHEERLARGLAAFAARNVRTGRRARCPLSLVAARLAARRRPLADGPLTLAEARS